MNFASDHVYTNLDEEYESIYEDEFERGMHVSDSDSDSDSDEAEELGAPPRPVFNSAANHPRGSRKRRGLKNSKYHWKRALGSRGLEQQAGASGSQQPKWQFRRADTNVVSVNFDTLLSPGNMHAGDPEQCPMCGAILSHISTMRGGEEKMWQCEFCGEEVPVDLEPEEIPRQEDVTYLLAPALATASTSMAGQDCSLVVFCMDVSGSMCVTSEISGRVKLRGTNQLRRLQSLTDDRPDQYLPSQRNREVTYVSRLQAMQAAVDHQLGEMAARFPDRRVALVAFNNEVAIMGDGSQQEVVVAGDKLKNLDRLREVTQGLTQPQAIKQTRQALGDKVYSLEEGGATALGPALVIAVNMAASHPGSKVILCTDGKANIGLGKLEVDEGDVDKTTAEEQAAEFYEKAAEEAAEKGVTVSVITIQGTDCKLVHLGAVADKTGGQVNIVDCLKLTEEFGNILADPIIATKVKATLILHKELYVVDDAEPDSQKSRTEQNVGNVKKSSNITFEYAKRRSNKESSAEESMQSGTSKAASQKAPTETQGEAQDEPQPSPSYDQTSPHSSPSGTKGNHPETAQASNTMLEFPFQLQIEYMDAEGNKALRVITRCMPATSDRKVSEKSANLEVLGAHAAKKSADLALQGQYTRSRGVALMNQRLAWRHAHSEGAPKTKKTAYKNIFSKIKNMENVVQRRQMSEISQFGRTHSDTEEEDGDFFDDGCTGQPMDAYRSEPAPQSLCSEPATRSLGALPLMRGVKNIFSKTKTKMKKLRSERSSEMDDDMANMIYQFRSVGSDQIVAPEPEAQNASARPSSQASPSSQPVQDQPQALDDFLGLVPGLPSRLSPLQAPLERNDSPSSSDEDI